MLSPRTLASLYDLHLAAVWRGHEPTSILGNWLEARWSASELVEPPAPPDAVSVLGGAGAGIRWYALGETIVGYVAGRPRGCYIVRRSEEPPLPPAILDCSPPQSRLSGAMQ
ncbi:MAG: hypothetical protein QOF01_4887 [Thermomicrobiales bacterium]|jgi:hypothetical protein|nr:hypothetical protein [Thermomicrobiales bacterium]